jgi:hypothetical protein
VLGASPVLLFIVVVSEPDGKFIATVKVDVRKSSPMRVFGVEFRSVGCIVVDFGCQER